MKRAAIYARVSTYRINDPCRKAQDVGIQLEELRVMAKRMGWDVTEFVDKGFSGRKESRPALDEMMKQVRQGRFDLVAVWRLDRLCRSLRQAVNLLSELKDLRVEFFSLKDGLNFSGALGMALYALVAALAEAEAEALRERTIAGLEKARRDGKRLGRPPNGTATVQQILVLKEQGISQAKIADELHVTGAYVSRMLKRYKSSAEHLAEQIEQG